MTQRKLSTGFVRCDKVELYVDWVLQRKKTWLDEEKSPRQLFDDTQTY